ncbi:MAG: penicillin acylase family protein, partial [Ferruginibacter sp.]
MPLKKILLLLLFPIQLLAQNFSAKEISRWQQQAKQVTITRDNWGIPHISGNTDADAVFGLLFAQCEDDFKRVELNYIEKFGRMAEVKGEGVLYDDLLLQLLIDTADAKKDYNAAAPWLKKLLNAYADGINYYLYKNPQVKPLMITRFQPWYPLLWTDGSIGAINTADISTAELKNFYSGDKKSAVAVAKDPDQQTGSNGFAFGPSITASGNAILYINPHVTFYFRPEVQVTSKEGLNAYGAVTWGQFFVYQGFNEHCGWMHTSNNVDVADLYEEKIITKNNRLFYEYDHQLKPVRQKQMTLRFKENNLLKTKNITAYFTQHGPVMAMRNNKWISLKSFNRSAISLQQSWLRTKAKGFEDYKKVMDLKANTSNSTVYADDKGNIAYWHGNFIPVRDKKLNWAAPVDGSISATEWKGLHAQKDIVHLFNPANGWLQNCNSTPFSVAGVNSPKKENYPAYMAPDGENFRGVNAV